MSSRRTHRCALLCWLSWLSTAGLAAAQQPAKPDARPVLEITQNTTLDPAKTYGRIVIKTPGITLDGAGAWVVGATKGDPKDYLDVGIAAKGVSGVTVKNLNVKGWQTGLKIEDGSKWTIENCNFSDNFHWPEYGWHWGQNDGRGGIVLDRISDSTVRKCQANRDWDACALRNSDNNLIEENDFSHASNTCVWMFTACGNVLRKNNLSYGLRIAPGETHARDSACVLVEAGSDNNRFLDNDITHGGDGVFIRALNGWVSRGNVFERNDASYAHNNCFEAQSPGNTYRHNKANYGSHGIWVGLSDETILEDNEVSHNGDPKGKHNAPVGLPSATCEPRAGAGGIILLGQANHSICRGNQCIENNGAGIVLAGNPQPSRTKMYHWILENNVVRDNRIGIYLDVVDWIDMAGNTLDNREDNLIISREVSNLAQHTGDPAITQPPQCVLEGPSTAKAGQAVVFDASKSTDPAGKKLYYRWDLDDGTPAPRSPGVTHAFKDAGFYRVGVTVTNGRYSDLGFRNFRVIDDIAELGTEGQAAEWSATQVEPREVMWSPQNYSPVGPPRALQNPAGTVEISDDKESFVAGQSSILVRVTGSGAPIVLRYPREKKLNIPLAGKTSVVFWSKYINPIVHAWAGMRPIVTLYETDQKFAILRPAGDSFPLIDERVVWRYHRVPLNPSADDKRWRRDGELPTTLNWITIEFPSISSLPMRAWIDGLGIK
jgi:parallel beta-helix repeat protein